MAKDIETWENDGGFTPDSAGGSASPMSGTPNQVEWAERIKRQVNEEFDRVAASFQVIAERQNYENRTDTEAIIAILNEKRTEVMSKQEAGYYIRDWQEIGDQVRQMIFRDARYLAIKRKRSQRR